MAAFKLKLVTGEEYSIDEGARNALISAVASAIVPVTVTLESGETQEIAIAKGAVSFIEGVPEESKSSGVSWGSVKFPKR